MLPGLEGEVVREVGLCVQQRLLVALALDHLALLQPQAPLLHVDDDGVRQVAPHHEQGAEHHLRPRADGDTQSLQGRNYTH